MSIRRSLSFVLPMLLVASCAREGAPPDDPNAIETALNQEFGGLSTSDEEPMFGEGEVYGDLDEADEDPAETPPADDPVAVGASTDADASVAEASDETIPEPSRPLVYALRAQWGRRIVDTTARDVTVWDPTFTTSCGFLAVRRLIAMEPGEGVVRPRSSAQSVSFTSSTAPASDGAVLLLVIPAAQRPCAATDRLTVTTAAVAAPIEIPLDPSLADTMHTMPIGSGVGMALIAHLVEPPRAGACLRGDLGGRWMRAIDRDGAVRNNLGRFYGRVTDEMGGLRGHIRGIYGVPREGRHAGKRVFFGKYIDLNGQFQGLLAGGYGPIDPARLPPDAPLPPPDGAFGGVWVIQRSLADTAVRGRLHGVYFTGPDEVPDGGLFHGRYASRECVRPIAPTPEELPAE